MSADPADKPDVPRAAERGTGVSASDAGVPLAGRSILVTRTREQAAALVEPLEALGAEVVAMPVLGIFDPESWELVDAAIADLDSYDWVVFTSANAVSHFLSRFKEVGGEREAILAPKVAAVGPATARALTHHGLPPVLVPEDFRAEGLIESFVALGAGAGWRILIPRALEAREILPDTLRELGCEVDVTPVYRTLPVAPDRAVIGRLRAGGFDAVTFTSGKIARRFVSKLADAGLDVPETMGRLTIASIGPVTTEAVRAMGFEVDVQASESTMPSLVEALVDALAGER